MLFNELRKCRLIRSGAVLSQCLALCKDDLVCAVLKQSIRKRGNVIAQQDCAYLFTAELLKLL